MLSFGGLTWLPDPLFRNEAAEKLEEVSDLFARNLDRIDTLLLSVQHLVTACNLLMRSEDELTGIEQEDIHFFSAMLQQSMLDCGGSERSLTSLREQLEAPQLKILMVGEATDRTAAAAALGNPRDLCGLGNLLSITNLKQLPANIMALTPCAFVFALRNDEGLERLLNDAKEGYDKMVNRRPSRRGDVFIDGDSFLFVFPSWDQLRSLDEALGKVHLHFPTAKLNKNVFFLSSDTGIDGNLDLKNSVLHLVPRVLQADHEAAFFWLEEMLGVLLERIERKLQAVRDMYDEAERGWRTMCCLIGQELKEAEATEKTLRQIRIWNQELRSSFHEMEVADFSQQFLDFIRSPAGLEELGRFCENEAPDCSIFRDVFRVVLPFFFDRLKTVFKAWNASGSTGLSKVEQLREKLHEKCRNTFATLQKLLPKDAGVSSIRNAFQNVPDSECEPSFPSFFEKAFRRVLISKCCSSSLLGVSLLGVQYASPTNNLVFNSITHVRRSYQSNKRQFIRVQLKTFVDEIIDFSVLKKEVERMLNLRTLEKNVNLCFSELENHIPTRITDIIKTKHLRKIQYETLQCILSFVHVVQNHVSSYYYEHVKHYEFKLPSSELQSGDFPAALLNKNFEESLITWSTISMRKNASLIRAREVAWHKLCKPCPRNLLSFFGCLKVHHEVFFVSESVTGNLQAYLQSAAVLRMPRTDREKQTRNFGTQIASGLKYVHSAHLVAHELCPGNILYRNRGDTLDIKLFCFGYETRVAAEPFMKVAQKDSGNLLYYMSPETLNWSICTRFSNVYTCGLILSDLFCGISPQRKASNNFCETEFKKVAETAEFPGFLKNLIMQCMEIEPTHRPTVEDIITALSQ